MHQESLIAGKHLISIDMLESTAESTQDADSDSESTKSGNGCLTENVSGRQQTVAPGNRVSDCALLCIVVFS